MRYMVRDYGAGPMRFKYTRVSEEPTDDELRADYNPRLLELQRNQTRDITIPEYSPHSEAHSALLHDLLP